MGARSSKEPDVIVIGAGAAGISAALALHEAGLAVTILEARDRIGGRIFTVHDPELRAPIELGAEFIHGRPRELWDLLTSHKIAITETDGDHWCAEDGQLRLCDFFPDVDKILNKMDGRKPDQSFSDFLKDYESKKKNTRREKRASVWATNYITGFNAADPALVGVHWLVKGMRADEKIEGERTFRAAHGYTDLIRIFQQQLSDSEVVVHAKSVVEKVTWRPGHVEVATRCPQGTTTFSSPRVLITVPLGVLQARPDDNGAIHFDPVLPPGKQNAIRGVMMGKVIRVTLRFRERFWEKLPKSRTAHSKSDSKTLDELSFLFSHDDYFPTWWTTMPQKLPFLIGWAPFHCAERLSGKNDSFIVEQSIATLHRLLGVSTQEIESLLQHTYFHDWQTDPFSRGAYSYGKVGEEKANQALGEPVSGTLFFAGEATDVSGHNGTVQGAIASGKRAASEIGKAAGRSIPHH